MSFSFGTIRCEGEVRDCAGSWALQAFVITLATAVAIVAHPNEASAQASDTIQVYSAPTSSANPVTVEKFTLTGAVVDSVTGEPIRKALVQIYTGQKRTAFSGDDGSFQLEGIPAGSYSVTAQKPGYFSQQELLLGGAPPVEVGPKSSSAIVKLTPESILSGKVTSTDGAPLEHVSLHLNYIEIREGRRRSDFKGIAITDDDGRYRFADLRPGNYYLSASPYTPVPDAMLEPDESPKTGYAGTYYPGVPDLASASPLQLAAGERGEANLTLNEVPVYAISGTVSGYAPNQGVSLQIFDQSGVLVDQGVQFSPDNGRFDVRALAAGNVRPQGLFFAGAQPACARLKSASLSLQICITCILPWRLLLPFRSQCRWIPPHSGQETQPLSKVRLTRVSRCPFALLASDRVQTRPMRPSTVRTTPDPCPFAMSKPDATPRSSTLANPGTSHQPTTARPTC